MPRWLAPRINYAEISTTRERRGGHPESSCAGAALIQIGKACSHGSAQLTWPSRSMSASFRKSRLVFLASEASKPKTRASIPKGPPHRLRGGVGRPGAPGPAGCRLESVWPKRASISPRRAGHLESCLWDADQPSGRFWTGQAVHGVD